jgi:transcriptional regulator with XRE-family HTH domain
MKTPNVKSSKVETRWVEGTVQDFLGLSDADMLIIETRLAASRLLRETRLRKRMTQQALAERLRTSQSRLAKMEAGDSSVSLELLLRSLFALGLPRKTVATIFKEDAVDPKSQLAGSRTSRSAAPREKARTRKAQPLSA